MMTFTPSQEDRATEPLPPGARGSTQVRGWLAGRRKYKMKNINISASGPPREVPRLREAQLIRTYRPQHPRYLPHHMRRQRTTSQDDQELREIYNEEEAGGERLFFSRTPRTVRRSDDINDNLRGYRRVL